MQILFFEGFFCLLRLFYISVFYSTQKVQFQEASNVYMIFFKMFSPSFHSFHSNMSQQQYFDMLPNDSASVHSSQNDNEFLPDRTNSYESMIKEHQQRRSLILNDQLVIPSGFSNQSKQDFLKEKSVEDMEGKLQGESGIDLSGLGKKEMEQHEENQFLINENSLVASIKEALRVNDSKIHSHHSDQKHFFGDLPSNEDPFPQESHHQKKVSSISNSQESIKYQQEQRKIEVSGFVGMDSKIQSNLQSHKNQHSSEIAKKQEESDPFQNVRESQNQSQNRFDQASHQEQTLKIHHSPFPQSSQHSNEANQIIKSSSINHEGPFLVNFSQEKHENIESKAQQMQKSRSQIQGLHSNTDLSKIQPQQVQKSKIIQQSHSQKEPFQNENSLSNLMKYNYFEKEYQKFKQIQSVSVQKQSESLQESAVRVLKLDKKQQEIPMSQEILKDNSEKSFQRQPSSKRYDSNQQIDHILMTHESKLNVSGYSVKRQKTESIIDHIDKVQSANRQSSQHDEVNNSGMFGEEQTNVHITLQQSIKIQQEHISQIRQLEQNRSRLSEKIVSQHQKEYHNEFEEEEEEEENQEGKFSQNQSKKIIFNSSHQHQQEKMQNIKENKKSQLQENQRELEKEQKSSKSKMQKSQNLNMPSIVHQSNRQQSSKQEKQSQKNNRTHNKQRSMIDKGSSRHSSDLHLPQIEIKSKKSSQISRKSYLNKKTPSIKGQNDSKISLRSSNIEPHSKKNSSKLLQSNERDKIISYSEGVPIQNQEERSQIYREVQLGSTTFDSKSIIMKKKQETVKQIFNTVPEEIDILNAEQPSIQTKQQNYYKQSVSPAINVAKKQIQTSIRSTTKERQEQLERIRALKEAQKKRLERQLQKVKKQLQEINTREKNMDRIYEQKQKIQIKERQNLISSRQYELHNKITKHHRQNDAFKNLIKEHKKPKGLNDQNGDPFEQNLTKNLIELNQIRQEAEQKQKEKKKLEILQRMKKNEMRKENEKKLMKANNQYIQQFRSVDNPIQSPQPIAQHLSKDKAGMGNKKASKQIASGTKISRHLLPQKRKMVNTYQEKLD